MWSIRTRTGIWPASSPSPATTISDVVQDQKAWERRDAHVASDALDGKFWLPEVGKATHYHATYVNPWWVRTMTKHSKLGIHIFYRPTRWGSLEDIPVWGDRLEVTGSIKRDAGPATPDKTRRRQARRCAAGHDPAPLDLRSGRTNHAGRVRPARTTLSGRD